jgi:uncharacterized protein with HEPN domain
MQKSLILYYRDILVAIEKVQAYIAKINFETFETDLKTQDAVIRNLEIIGEAIKKIPPTIRDLEPNIPWKSYAGIRDIIAHYYFRVDLNAVWTTAKDDLPILKNAISRLLEEKEKEISTKKGKTH